MSGTGFRHVTAPDGTRLALEERGAVTAVPVVLLHGIAQGRASFRGVLDGPLASSFRLVAFDMRGHGDSDGPGGDDAYASGDRLGDDLHGVLSALGLARPIVVAWSYGGVVVGEYLRKHGAGALGGILFVAAAVRTGRPARGLLGPAMLSNGRALMSEDAAVYERGARDFVNGCAAAPLPDGPREDAVSSMLRVPVHVRRALLGRSEDFTPELAACDVPVATLQGTHDQVVLPAMSELVTATCPQAAPLGLLDGVGHLPWLEAPAAFEEAVRATAARRITP